MPFDTAVKQDVDGLDAGELFGGHVGNTDAFIDFEDGLNIGRFAKYDTGSLDNLDNSATPKIAGVVKRNLTGDLTKTVYDTEDDVADLVNFGYVTVEVVDGDTPAKYGAVYAHNDSASTVDYGRATTTTTNNVEVVGADFWKEIKTNVWVVRLKTIL